MEFGNQKAQITFFIYIIQPGEVLGFFFFSSQHSCMSAAFLTTNVLWNLSRANIYRIIFPSHPRLQLILPIFWNRIFQDSLAVKIQFEKSGTDITILDNHIWQHNSVMLRKSFIFLIFSFSKLSSRIRQYSISCCVFQWPI